MDVPRGLGPYHGEESQVEGVPHGRRRTQARFATGSWCSTQSAPLPDGTKVRVLAVSIESRR